MLVTDTVCISHKEDPDGIVSAILIKQLFSSDVLLTDYSDLIDTLRSVTKNKFKQIFICDLALKLSNIDELFSILSTIKHAGAKIWFVDHHVLPEGANKKFNELDVSVLHQETDCTSAIIYGNFRDKLQKNASLLTACACITDGMEDGSVAQKVIRNNEKMFTLLNSALMWYAIRENQNNDKELYRLLSLLSSGKLPFEVITKIDSFSNALAKELNLEYMEGNVRHYRNFDCLKIRNNKLSNSATRLLSRSEKAICLVHKDYDDGLAQEIIVLSTKKNTKNLGLTINLLSTKLRGFGGGDPHKSAAVIPTTNFDNFLELLDLELD